MLLNLEMCAWTFTRLLSHTLELALRVLFQANHTQLHTGKNKQTENTAEHLGSIEHACALLKCP